MPIRPDVPCASCGKLMALQKGKSLPAGEAVCRACRACRLARAHCHRSQPCADCGVPTAGVRCRRCAGDARKKPKVRRVYFPECIQCGALFTTQHPGQLNCSTECAYKRTQEGRDHKAENARRRGARYCGCGALLRPRQYKCERCVYLNKRARKTRYKQRRRAAKLGAEVVESFTLTEIAERDRHRCGLCHRKVDMTKCVPHPRSPTLDHVIPLSKGGDHSRANAQLAHFLCNSIKGDRGEPQQLALLG